MISGASRGGGTKYSLGFTLVLIQLRLRLDRLTLSFQPHQQQDGGVTAPVAPVAEHQTHAAGRREGGEPLAQPALAQTGPGEEEHAQR